MFKVRYRAIYSDETSGFGTWYIEDTLHWKKIVCNRFNEKMKVLDCRLVDIFPDVYSVQFCESLLGYVKITHVKNRGD